MEEDPPDIQVPEKRAAMLGGIARSRDAVRAEATVTMEIRVVEPQTAEPHQWKSRFSRDEVGLPVAWVRKKRHRGTVRRIKRLRFEGGSEGRRPMHDATLNLSFFWKLEYDQAYTATCLFAWNEATISRVDNMRREFQQ